MALDCLWAAGRDLRGQALRTRRARLDEVLDGPDVLLPERRLADDGLKAWEQVVERGYEGLVAKDPALPSVRAARASPRLAIGHGRLGSAPPVALPRLLCQGRVRSARFHRKRQRPNDGGIYTT